MPSLIIMAANRQLPS